MEINQKETIKKEQLTNEEYWELSPFLRQKQDMIDSKRTETETIRFYLWDYCRSYGWRISGNTNGYTSLKELISSDTYQFEIENKRPFVITESKIIMGVG